MTPNAQKIEQHRLKLERKQADKEQKERVERARKAREAHEKAAKVEAETEFEGGIPLGGMGGAGMGDFYKLLQDPEIMAGLQVCNLKWAILKCLLIAFLRIRK